MEKALDLIEAGSLPYRHSHACVVVDEAEAAEVELSFFDYQRQAYIGESGLSPRPYFFSARQRTLTDGRAGYVVSSEVTRFLRRDARFGGASRERRLGDVRCKARTYVDTNSGPLPVEFAVARQDRSQGERREISIDASSSPRPVPFSISISAKSAAYSRKPALDVSIPLENRKEERAGHPEFGASAPAEPLQEHMASSAPETATVGGTTQRAEPERPSWMQGSILLAIGLLGLLAVALSWPPGPVGVAMTETPPAFEGSKFSNEKPSSARDEAKVEPVDQEGSKVEPNAVLPPMNMPDTKRIKPKEQTRPRIQRRVAHGVQGFPRTKTPKSCFTFNGERYCN